MNQKKELKMKTEYEREICKCKHDIVYFAEKYFYCTNADRDQKSIKLYDYQKTILRSFASNKTQSNIDIEASRQVGKSVLIVIACAWNVLNNGGNTVILSYKMKNAELILKQVRDLIESFCYELYKMMGSDNEYDTFCVRNKYSLEFWNGISITAKSIFSQLKGDASINYFLDEYCFAPCSEKTLFLECALPVIKANRRSKIFSVGTGVSMFRYRDDFEYFKVKYDAFNREYEINA